MYIFWKVSRLCRHNLGQSKLMYERQSTKDPYNSHPGIKFDEIFCLRFPEIADSIFENVDNQSLVNCLEASRDFEHFLRSQSQKLYLKRKIQKIVEAHDEFSGMWKTVLKNVNTETIIHLEFLFPNFMKISGFLYVLLSIS